MTSIPVLDSSSLEQRENISTISSSLIKKRFQKFYKTLSSGISKTRCVSKVVSIADKILKFVELVASIDLSIIRTPFKAVKNITSTVKLVNKTSELVGTDDKPPFWKTAKKNHLKTARKIISFVASVLKTFKFIGEVGLFSLAKIGEAIGKVPVLGMISKLPFGVFIKAIDLLANILGVIEDVRSLFKIDKRKEETISSQSKWEKRCDDLKEILRAIKEDIKKEQERKKDYLSAIRGLNIDGDDRFHDDDSFSGGSDYEGVDLGASDSLSSSGYSMCSEHSAVSVSMSSTSASTIDDDYSIQPKMFDTNSLLSVSSGHSVASIDFLPRRHARNKNEHERPIVYTRNDLDEYDTLGDDLKEKTSSECVLNVDGKEILIDTQKMLPIFPLTQEPVLVYPENSFEEMIAEKKCKIKQILKEPNEYSQKVFITRTVEGVVENQSGQKDDVTAKIKFIANHYRQKADFMKSQPVDKQVDVKLIKWENIVESLESKDLSKIESLNTDWSVKHNQKKYENFVLKKTKQQKTLSVVYRAAKIVVAIACIGLFFSGVGVPVVFAIYAALGVLTLCFGLVKYGIQNHFQKRINSLEKKYSYLNYQTIKV